MLPLTGADVGDGCKSSQSCPWVGLGWVGSVSWWVGLDRVTQNGPTDNSESSGYDDRAASVVHGYCINYSRASTTPGLLETPGI